MPFDFLTENKMAKKKEKKIDNSFENLESSISRTEQFIEDNQKLLTIIFGVLVLIVGAYFAYTKFVVEPQTIEAQEQIFTAQLYFERDSFDLALNGDGDFPGVLGIIDEYGATNVSELANYYAGVSYFKLGEYDNAIDYLSDFSTSDKLLSAVSMGTLGDAYSEKGNFNKAASYYKKAADETDNKLTCPIYLKKYGVVSEELKDFKEALEVYKKIKLDFPDSEEGRTIDKYITRVKLKM